MLVDKKQASQILRSARLLAVPTETVYGIAADLKQDEAILGLYNLKKREVKKPIVIQLAEPNDVFEYLTHVPYELKKLIQKFWPGALTIVLPVHEGKISGLLRANQPAAGFRVSAHPGVRELIRDYGPLAITSANLSGQAPLLNTKEIEREFGEDFPILKTKDQEADGIASTVIAYIDATWVALRLGSVSLKHLSNVLGYYPPVVSDINMKKSTYTLRPQLHLKEEPYDGSIGIVMGFEDRTYPSSETVLTIGSLSQPKDLKKKALEKLKEIQLEGYPHVWVDLNFPKTGELKDLAEVLERAVRSG